MDSLVRIPAELMRDALLGAGTSVWEWDVRSDRLANIDTSSALLGYAPGELVSDQDTWNRLIHPEDVVANHEAYLRHARGELPIYEHEYRARAKDGRWCWLAERGRIVERDARGEPARMVGTLSDISARRRAQGEALEMAERLAKISRHVPGIVFQFRRRPDGSSYFPYLSESCIDLLGLAPPALMHDASDFIRMVEREDRDRVLASIAASARGLKPWRCEFRLHRRDGSLCWLGGAGTPQREPEGTVLWHGYIQDITDQYALAQARESAAAAQAANRAKTEFLSRMSHELRTPLNAVLGFAQLLELDTREPLGAAQRRRVTLIREAGAHLLQMIGELLDLTRIEAGQFAVTPTRLALAPLLAESIEMVQPQADAAGVQVQLDPIDPALAVHADAMRLRQVLLNLLGNAIKYNRPAGSVRLGAARQGTQVGLQVVDTGVGIDAAELPRLFEPFYRGAHRHSTIEGAGIGLAVTRALVELMGGRVEVRSMPGQGSTFSVWLPAEAGAEAGAEAPAEPAPDQTPSLPT